MIVDQPTADEIDHKAAFIRESGSRERDPINLPTFYASMLPDIRRTARECGYAITIHGSMARDFDLVAIPWIKEAKSAEELVVALCESMRTFTINGEDSSAIIKPHGRRAWKLYFGGQPYLDLSIMPLIIDQPDATANSNQTTPPTS